MIEGESRINDRLQGEKMAHWEKLKEALEQTIQKCLLNYNRRSWHVQRKENILVSV